MWTYILLATITLHVDWIDSTLIDVMIVVFVIILLIRLYKYIKRLAF